jgi:hypothetical protein
VPDGAQHRTDLCTGPLAGENAVISTSCNAMNHSKKSAITSEVNGCSR